MPVGRPILAYPSVQRTPICLFLSLWTASSSMKTNCVADRRNSEFWQRIGQPYARNLGRCFVACPPSMSTTATKHFPGSRTRPITQSFTKTHDKRMKKACYQNKISFIFKKAITLIILQNIVPVHNK